MSKDVEWGAMYGEGDIVCTCDNCGEEFRYPFEDVHPAGRFYTVEFESLGGQFRESFTEVNYER